MTLQDPVESAPGTRGGPTRPRIEWLDHARGFCIILVVMLYATELAGDRGGGEGWLHTVAQFARPFRMPDFFVLSGLLLPLVIARDWRTYLDRKVVHFAYFYLLWVAILVAFRALSGGGVVESAGHFLRAFYHPYSLLWFIFMLPVFFVVTKATRSVSPWVVWLAAAALQSLPFEVEVRVVEKFCRYFVFFYSGYILAPHVFRFADAVAANPARSWVALAAWAAINGYLVFAGFSLLPGISLALALAGSAAVIALAALVSPWPAARWAGYCGAHSIVIYLGFFIPMTIVRKLLASMGLVNDVGWMSAIATVAGVLGALALYWAVRGTKLRFLFERPRAFSIAPARVDRAFPLEDTEISKAT